MSHRDFSIRPVENCAADLTILARYCHDLATHDGHTAHLDAEKLGRQMFGSSTNVRAFLVFVKDEPVGFILVYESFTVYYGERGLYIPGAFVVEKYRNQGYGRRLFSHVADYAEKNGYAFLNWIVDSGNERTKNIYRKMGASISENWCYVRIDRPAMRKLAEGDA